MKSQPPKPVVYPSFKKRERKSYISLNCAFEACFVSKERYASTWVEQK